MTLVSYSTKKNKNVILLSTTHDDGIIDVETRKPEIIMDYNRTKGGVDTVDKLSATFSVSRITRRWSLAAIYGVLNLSGINAQIIDKSLRGDNSPKYRRVFLHNLALALTDAHLATRSSIRSLPIDVKAFLTKIRKTQHPESSCERVVTKKQRGTCARCGRGRNTSASATCDRCGEFTCKQHAVVTTLCNTCTVSDDDTESD
ncbi:piggyBac transposable element-derived protein 4-like [Armigeres subalbatus]|uniref:piggyBac transposable element-derived protein 4-like n=1 Tax=Armigeres subalbatus TaxID=124917 RepID=UPI002ED49E90